MAEDRDRPMFSNGTEYDMWQDRWCHNCQHQSREFGGPCDDFALTAVVDLQVPEFIESWSGGWLCTRFEVARVEPGHDSRSV